MFYEDCFFFVCLFVCMLGTPFEHMFLEFHANFRHLTHVASGTCLLFHNLKSVSGLNWKNVTGPKTENGFWSANFVFVQLRHFFSLKFLSVEIFNLCRMNLETIFWAKERCTLPLLVLTLGIYLGFNVWRFGLVWRAPENSVHILNHWWQTNNTMLPRTKLVVLVDEN